MDMKLFTCNADAKLVDPFESSAKTLNYLNFDRRDREHPQSILSREMSYLCLWAFKAIKYLRHACHLFITLKK
jgi:hypothetical protein